MRQERVIEYVGAREADTAHDEEQRSDEPVAAFDEVEQRRAGHAEEDEDGHHAFLGAQEIGHRPQDRTEDRHQQQADGSGERPVDRGRVGLVAVDGYVGIIDRQDGRHDTGGKDRIGPVIHRPGPDGALVLFLVHEEAP